MSAAVAHGWTLFVHEYFEQRLEALVAHVEMLSAKDPDGFVDHPVYKLFEDVDAAIRDRVPRNPQASEYKIGQLLGKGTGHWCRVKKGLPQRYRLFFQYRSASPKTIIYCWLNDHGSFRKEGSRTDVYAVFKRMIESKNMPNSYEDLVKIARELPATG